MKRLLVSALAVLALGIVIGSALEIVVGLWVAVGILAVIFAIALIGLLTSKEV